MPILANPKQDKIKTRKITFFQFKKSTNSFFIQMRRGLRVTILRLYGMNVHRRNFNFCKKRFRHHPIIALLIFGRHPSFIAPEKMYFFPPEFVPIKSDWPCIDKFP